MATEKSSDKDPWEKPAPKKSRHVTLTPASKAKAKADAKKAGRKYPSLVDNMNAAKKQRRKSGKKSADSGKRTAFSKSSRGKKPAARQSTHQ